MGRRKSPGTDPQREEVYRWEEGFASIHRNTADREWFEGLVTFFCRRYRVKAPKVSSRVPKRFQTEDRITAAVCHWKAGKIYFDRRFMSSAVLCHELAHWVCDSYGYGDVGAHGPKWLGVYLWMLGKAAVLPLDLATHSARKAGLKFRDPKRECAPGKLKRYLK